MRTTPLALVLVAQAALASCRQAGTARGNQGVECRATAELPRARARRPAAAELGAPAAAHPRLAGLRSTPGPGAVLSVSATNAPAGAMVRFHPVDGAGLGAGSAPVTRSYPVGTRVWVTAPLRSGDDYFVGWRVDGADYDTASTTSIVLGSDATAAAVYETPSCAGTAVPPGVDSLANAVATTPGGSTFCLQRGTHRFTRAVVGRAGDRFIGEAGAVLSGAKLLTSFSREGSAWVAAGQEQQEAPWPVSQCCSSAPLCGRPEKVFVDDEELWQVGTLGELGPGAFYFDYTHGKIYLADDPTGHTVEATTGSPGIIGFLGGDSDRVTVRNLSFEKFGGGEGRGPLKSAAGWTIENNEIRQSSYAGVEVGAGGVVRNNYIHHLGKYGVVGGSGTFEGNVISYGNTDGFDPNNDAGGSKFHAGRGLVVRGNVASFNTGRAFWADYDAIDTTYENNVIEGNTEAGIFHEVSCSAVIRNNVLSGNNTALAGASLWLGGQIYARTSKDLDIYGNDVTTSVPGANGIALRQDSPEAGPSCGSLTLQNVAVHDNVIRLAQGSLQGDVGGDAGYCARNGVRFYGNTYYMYDPAAAVFWNDDATRPLTREQWQAASQDTGSTFLSY